MSTAAAPVGDSWRDGVVPPSLDDAVARAPLLEVAADRALVRVPGVARYLVPARGQVTVAADPGATAADVRCFLRGPVAAIASMLRGTFSLRGAAVSVNGRGVALCGPPAVGKSTLAAALASRGHPVLAETLVPVGLSGGAAVVWPIAEEVELWPAAARRLGLDVAGGRPVRPRSAKRAFGVPGPPAPPEVTLSLVVVLMEDPRVSEPELRPVDRGADRIPWLRAMQWYPQLVGPLGLGIGHLDWVATVASQATLVRAVRPRRRPSVDRLADLVQGMSR